MGRFQLASILLTAMGALLFFEIIRPFRDMKLDGPLAMSSLIAAAAVSGWALYQKKGNKGLNIAILAINAVALGGLLLLLAMAKPAKLF